MPIPQNKIQQFVAQFACRIPARRELTAGEKNALENLLRELNRDHFQLPMRGSPQDPALLFSVDRQNAIGASVITAPTFTFHRDSFSFYYPIMMMNRFISGYTSIVTRDRNNTISTWANRVFDVVNTRCQRAGKIYLMALGPFEHEEKNTIFRNLFSNTFSLDEIGEFNFSFAYYRTVRDQTYNILNQINFAVNNLTDRFFVSVKVDINNRDLREAMEPPNIERVWNTADEIIFNHLDSILNVT